MTPYQTKFEALLNDKKIPFDYHTIETGNHLYRLNFKLNEEKIVLVEVIIQNTEEEYLDVQVIYRNLYQVSDFSQHQQALAMINELNEIKTGYYHLFLAGDGEIYLKALMRTGMDPQPLYETIVVGSVLSRKLLDEMNAAQTSK